MFHKRLVIWCREDGSVGGLGDGDGGLGWGGYGGGGYMGDYGDAPGNVTNEGSYGAGWGMNLSETDVNALAKAYNMGDPMQRELYNGWDPALGFADNFSNLAMRGKQFLSANKAGATIGGLLGTAGSGVIPGLGLFGSFLGAGIQDGFRTWSNQTPEERMATLDAQLSGWMQEAAGTYSTANAPLSIVSEAGNNRSGVRMGVPYGTGNVFTQAGDWTGVPDWFVRQYTGGEGKTVYSYGHEGQTDNPGMNRSRQQEIMSAYNQYVMSVNDPVGYAQQSQQYQQAKQDIYGMLQEWYTTTGLDTASQVTNLAAMTGGLTDQEKSMLDIIQQNAIDKLSDTLNTERENVMAKAVARLSGRGVMDSTIASGLIGDIESEVLKQLGQGTADITSKRMSSELALTESRADRSQDWQKALLDAYTRQRGQDLNVTENEADRQMKLAIANLEKDVYDESNWWQAGGSLVGGLLGNWKSIFG